MGSEQPSVGPVSSSSIGDRSEGQWGHLDDNSVNAVSFGFVATAVLISMFLVMAIFERFLSPRSAAAASRNPGDLEAHTAFNGKPNFPSPKMTTYARGVSVLMPGDEIPTFIAHPVPAPCPRECISPPLHQHHTLLSFTSSSITNPNPNRVESSGL
ncbi:uncharacterized protein LOC130774288 [Actinidia eriantha]|uniref:uncharacterized protein LOC130751182 n=1 Tax=Actinidia eriantha TaxID=165200 RepID=UPI00258E31B7|nr:uncharacterized protein LOC130751182 [Actinidia eriantha]XP_057488285.1 uncharacterized protein LOC130774288 [Actinidia eriantha]